MPKVKTTNAKPITEDMEKTMIEDNEKKSKVKVKMFEEKVDKKKVDKKNIKTKKKKY
tara:strand:- start:1333 stop:1503 length:171 start_codon:yes stop_codon:yes gene_type:complete